MSKQKQVGFVTMGATAGGKKIKEIGIGMLGYAFMGKAHSNAYRKIQYMTWPPPLMPKLVAICGRNEPAVAEAARRYGYESYTTDWKRLVKDDRIQLFDTQGNFISQSLLDYCMPSAGQIPPVRIAHLHTPSPLNPLGVKGLGEGGAMAPPAAIANAVEDALGHLGVRIDATPITPTRLAALLRR